MGLLLQVVLGPCMKNEMDTLHFSCIRLNRLWIFVLDSL